MFDSEPTPVPQEERNTTLQLIKLAHHMLVDYCAIHNIPPETAAQRVAVNVFLDWARQRFDMMTQEDAESLRNEAKVSPKAFDTLSALAHDELGPNKLAGVWSQVVLQHRGNPTFEVESLHTICLVKWKDGRSGLLSNFVPAELASEEAVFTDGMICTLIQTSAHALMEIVRDNSLDRLHSEQSMDASDASYDILMGLLLKIIQGASIIEQGQFLSPEAEDALKQYARKLDPKKRAGCEGVMRTLQAMFRPPIPPQVVELIQHRRAKRLAKMPSHTPPTYPASGWDDS